MTRFRSLFAAALIVSAGLAVQPQPADAASAVMCARIASGAAPGPARWVAPSGTAYSLDNRGCAVIASADVAGAAAGGFVQPGSLKSLIVTTGVLSGTTSVQVATLPAGAYIREFLVENTTANAVTGGVNIGKTTGAADIVSALTCGASCLTFVGDVALLLRNFSKTVPQAIWVTAQTGGNSANLTITIVYGYF